MFMEQDIDADFNDYHYKFYVCFGDCRVEDAAASIDSSGLMYLGGYRKHRPADYPNTGSVLSTGASTVLFLQALGVIMEVGQLRLVDTDCVPGTDFPVAFSRMALGWITWYESFGFSVGTPEKLDYRIRLGQYLESIPPLLVVARTLV